MSCCKKGNSLIIIENGNLSSYSLDDKKEWKIGRASGDNRPDIALSSKTISRKHGSFENSDGFWYYQDCGGKNGTVLNHKHIVPRKSGMIMPVLLEDGARFVFGGSEEEVFNCKTVFGLYMAREYDDSWRVIDTKGCESIRFISEGKTTKMNNPLKGTVVNKSAGTAIYMGDLSFAIGDMEVVGN